MGAVTTVYVDASWCPDTGVGGWGAWIRRDGTVRLVGGAFKQRMKDNIAAEFAAAANGIAAAAALGVAKRSDILVVVSDCQQVEQGLRDGSGKGWGAIAHTARKLAQDNGYQLRVNWVRGHSGRSNPRSYVNDLVDKEAKRHMRAARAAARRPGAAFASGIVAYHGTTDDIAAFRPLSHFGTAKAAADRVDADWRKGEDGVVPGARTYPVVLDIRAPLDLEDLGNHTPLDFAAALWRAGVVGEDFAKAVVLAVAEAERRDAAAWAISCGNLGIRDKMAWVRDPAAAEAAAAAVTAAEAVEALWAAHGSPDGLRHCVRHCVFPHEKVSFSAAVGLIVAAIEAAGYDGVRYVNTWEDEGSVSWVALRPEQVTVVAAPAAVRPAAEPRQPAPRAA